MKSAPSLVFLCYSRRDRGIVRKCQVVIRAAGLVPWRDEDSIEPGAGWKLAISKAINQCDRVLVFWCCHAAKSKHVRAEIWEGITAHKTMCPIRLDRTDLPAPLGEYQATDMPGWTSISHLLLRAERWIFIAGAAMVLLGLLIYRVT